MVVDNIAIEASARAELPSREVDERALYVGYCIDSRYRSGLDVGGVIGNANRVAAAVATAFLTARCTAVFATYFARSRV